MSLENSGVFQFMKKVVFGVNNMRFMQDYAFVIDE